MDFESWIDRAAVSGVVTRSAFASRLQMRLAAQKQGTTLWPHAGWTRPSSSTRSNARLERIGSRLDNLGEMIRELLDDLDDEALVS